jgi:hypothetical protein
MRLPSTRFALPVSISGPSAWLPEMTFPCPALAPPTRFSAPPMSLTPTAFGIGTPPLASTPIQLPRGGVLIGLHCAADGGVVDQVVAHRVALSVELDAAVVVAGGAGGVHDRMRAVGAGAEAIALDDVAGTGMERDVVMVCGAVRDHWPRGGGTGASRTRGPRSVSLSTHRITSVVDRGRPKYLPVARRPKRPDMSLVAEALGSHPAGSTELRETFSPLGPWSPGDTAGASSRVPGTCSRSSSPSSSPQCARCHPLEPECVRDLSDRALEVKRLERL